MPTATYERLYLLQFKHPPKHPPDIYYHQHDEQIGFNAFYCYLLFEKCFPTFKHEEEISPHVEGAHRQAYITNLCQR